MAIAGTAPAKIHMNGIVKPIIFFIATPPSTEDWLKATVAFEQLNA
jgi:hypothetical protein